MESLNIKYDKPIIAEVDDDLEELIPEFFANRRSDIERIRESLESSDFDTIRILGHSMKGSGGGYGFDGITDIGAALELAATQKAVEEIRTLNATLQDYLDRVKIVYTPYG